MAFLSSSIRKAQGQMGRSAFAPGRSGGGMISRAIKQAPRTSPLRQAATRQAPMRMGGFGNRGFSGTIKPMRSGGGFTRQLGMGPTGGFRSARTGKYGRKFGGRCG